MQQQQILQKRYTMLACHFLAEAHELPYLITKIRQYFKIVFIKGQRFKLRYGRIYRKSL